MEMLSSREAADRHGWSVQKFHRLAAIHQLTPAMELPGIRGAKFWRPEDVDRLVAAESEAAS